MGGLHPGCTRLGASRLAVGHTTFIQQLVKLLLGGAATTDMLLLALAGCGALTFQRPCQTDGGTGMCGDLNLLFFHHATDAGKGLSQNHCMRHLSELALKVGTAPACPRGVVVKALDVPGVAGVTGASTREHQA